MRRLNSWDESDWERIYAQDPDEYRWWESLWETEPGEEVNMARGQFELKLDDVEKATLERYLARDVAENRYSEEEYAGEHKVLEDILTELRRWKS